MCFWIDRKRIIITINTNNFLIRFLECSNVSVANRSLRSDDMFFSQGRATVSLTHEEFNHFISDAEHILGLSLGESDVSDSILL